MLVAPASTPVETSVLTLNDIRQLGFAKVSYVPERSPPTSAGVPPE
jgi:hypothetical protein